MTIEILASTGKSSLSSKYPRLPTIACIFADEDLLLLHLDFHSIARGALTNCHAQKGPTFTLYSRNTDQLLAGKDFTRASLKKTTAKTGSPLLAGCAHCKIAQAVLEEMVTSFCYPTSIFPLVKRRRLGWVRPAGNVYPFEGRFRLQWPKPVKANCWEDTPTPSALTVHATNPASAIIAPSNNTLLPPMPAESFFLGFFGLTLFGSLIPEEYKSALVTTGECLLEVSKSKSVSRRTGYRRTAAKEKGNAREKGKLTVGFCGVAKLVLMQQGRWQAVAKGHINRVVHQSQANDGVPNYIIWSYFRSSSAFHSNIQWMWMTIVEVPR